MGSSPDIASTAPGAAQAVAGAQAMAQPRAEAVPASQQVPALVAFEDVVALVREQRDAMLLMHLEDHASLVSFEPGRIELNLLPAAPAGLAGDLGAKLSKWTDARWIVTVSNAEGAEPLGVVRRRNEARALAELRDHPAVKAVLASLPDTEIEAVLEIAAATETGEDPGDDDISDPEADPADA